MISGNAWSIFSDASTPAFLMRFGKRSPLLRAAPTGRGCMGFPLTAFFSVAAAGLDALVTRLKAVIFAVLAGSALAFLVPVAVAFLRPGFAGAVVLLALSTSLRLRPRLAGLEIFLTGGFSSWLDEGVNRPVSLRGRFFGVELITTDTVFSSRSASDSSSAKDTKDRLMVQLHGVALVFSALDAGSFWSGCCWFHIMDV